MWDLETIKFMNSPRGAKRIAQLARACNRVKQGANYPKHNTGRKPVRRKKAPPAEPAPVLHGPGLPHRVTAHLGSYYDDDDRA